MVRDREPQNEDLNEDQRRQIVDEVDFVLKGRDAGARGARRRVVGVLLRVEHVAPHDGRVGREVGDQEEPDRKDAAQRVKTPKQVVVALQKRNA